jgi:DNA-binding NarL/FixJ family response regulator
MEVLIIDDNKNDAQEVRYRLKKHIPDIIINEVYSFDDFKTCDKSECDVFICDWEIQKVPPITAKEVLIHLNSIGLGSIPFVLISGTERTVFVEGHEFVSKKNLDELPKIVIELYRIHKLSSYNKTF